MNFFRTVPMRVFALLMITSVFVSCKGDDDEPIEPTGYTDGVIVLNEGGFTAGNASVDFVANTDFEQSSSIFSANNNRPLGDVLQSMEIIDGKGYLVVNNSGKVEVVDLETFEASATITGLTSPRFIKKARPGFAYVSDLFGGSISVVDLASNTISSTIAIGNWSEEMRIVSNKAYVCLADTNLVAVIDATNDNVLTPIVVTRGPNSMVRDQNGKLWVLCDGGWMQDVPALVRFDPATQTVEASYAFASTSDSPNSLVINDAGNELYFLNGDVYKMSINASAIPTSAFYAAGSRQFYGLGVQPSDGSVWVADAADFTGNGYTLKLDASNASVLHLDTVGVNPNGFIFR